MTMTRNYEKFFTPDDIADKMVSLLKPLPGKRYLEPSAGNGSLVRAVKRASPASIVYAIERNYQHESDLNGICDWWEINDFIGQDDYENWLEFHGCIANPPFGNGTDLQAHFDKICRMVCYGGKVVMIVPSDFHPTVLQYKVHPVENWSKNTDGTTTKIKIIEFFNK